ncbi:cytochrome P450 4V2 [Caerostris extrusa]|uniref:Cytochrome P450 4V2 n=1 Tax=Caerostris extrusa TaxID=172846 RepID=A0AAV4WRP0_CAEEX|nr:cytochrome P450 4V2 [Caerostris extrusa]
MLLEIVACVSIVVIALLAKLSWWRQQCNRLIPNNQPSFFNPLGEVLEYDGIMAAFVKWTNKLRKYPLFCAWLTYMPFVLIHKSEAVKELLQVQKHIQKSWFYYFTQAVVGKGLFTGTPRFSRTNNSFIILHVTIKVIVASGRTGGSCSPPCFQSNMLKGYLTVFNEHSLKFVKHLMKETEKEFTSIEEPISLCALDILCECIMGVKMGEFENERKQYVESLHRTLDLVMARILKFWQTIIDERKRRYLNGEKADDSSRYKSLLEVLLKLHIEDQALDEKGVRQEVDTFIIAGHDTQLQPLSNRSLSVDDLSDLKYLDCVLKECSRLYPSVPQFGRQISEETKICGYTIPKGASANVMTYFLHRDEDVFLIQRNLTRKEDQQELQKKRKTVAQSLNMTYRIISISISMVTDALECIKFSVHALKLFFSAGRFFGEMEVKTMVCHTLRNFTLHSLDSRDKVLPVMNVTLQSSLPIRIRFRPRHNNNK